MVRFARSGGEANAIAIRIARAASERIKLPFVDTMVGMTGTSRLIWQMTRILMVIFC